MKKEVIIIIAALVIVIALFFLGAFYTNNAKNPGDNSIISNTKTASGNPGSNISIEASNKTSITEAGASSSSGGSSQSTDNSNNNAIPSDINSRECGYYFSEYGICEGTCPQGACVSEGRSCYCKSG